MRTKILLAIAFALILASCVSTNKSREEYFGYNNKPKYEEKKVASKEQSTSYVYSYEDKKSKKQKDEPDNQSITIINNNYYPYPYDPFFVRNYDPYDFNFYFYYGTRTYDPFWDYYVIYVPYNRRHHYVCCPSPYWDYYWWERRPRIVYVPYDYPPEKPRERTVRDFGPSRGVVDENARSVPTKEPRSGSRDEGVKKSIVPPSEPDRNNEPVQIKLPEKSSTPKESPRTETPKSEPKTKQERSSTRPR